MRIIYGLLIRNYYFFIFIFSIFHWKARKFMVYRFGWKKTLKTFLSRQKKLIWIYSPSIGEYQECRRFVKKLIESKNECQFIFTFHSLSGYDQAVFPEGDIIRLMLPLDSDSGIDRKL